jgi:exosortase
MATAHEKQAAPAPTKAKVGRRKQKPVEKAVLAKVKQPAAAEVAVGGPPTAVRLAVAALAAAVGLWSYWPTLVTLVDTWEREPDYSHGYLVAPLALFFLWARREKFPGWGKPAYAIGAFFLISATVIRYFGARFYFEFIDGWTIVPWIAGVVAILGGGRILWWALPSIGFLFFMVPLPYGIETALSGPLQKVATKLSTYALQLFGQPAFAEGNVILLGEHQLEVAQACSGLRLFMSVVALAYAYVVLVRRAWWERAILLLAVAPIAVVANAARIVATGFLFQYTTGETAHRFAHDFAGWAMIPLAAVMFWAVLWYLSKLIREEEVVEMSALVRNADL